MLNRVRRLHSYVHHNGKYAGMVELSCQTDFCANSQEFKQFANDLAMHVAVTPLPEPFEYCDASSQYSWKPFLVKQPFVKDQEKTLGGLLKDIREKTGETVDIHYVSRREV